MELKSSEKRSIIYHSIFNYPLTETDLKKWTCKYKFDFNQKKIQFKKVNGFYVLKGQEKNIKKRLNNEKYSKKKLIIAQKASSLISKIPTVLFVGITGSLAMMNANKDSDIDLMIITKRETLWITRPFVYMLLMLFNFKIRVPKTLDEKDRLCLNLWLDEDSLIWSTKTRNIFTAHEMCQINPIISKEFIYNKLINSNRWIYKYWEGVNVQNNLKVGKKKETLILVKLLNFLLFNIQMFYMKNKITSEKISLEKALFHPNDNSNDILNTINKLNA